MGERPTPDDLAIEAAEYARSVGVAVDFAGRADLAALVVDTLARANGRVELPRRVRVSLRFLAEYQMPEACAMTEPDREIVINPAHEYWANPSAWTQTEGPAGTKYISTMDPAHVLLHELGHLAHMASDFEVAVARDFPRSQDIAVAGRVSGHSRQAPGEFVAEAFAGMFVGLQYDAQVMELYRRLAGPNWE